MDTARAYAVDKAGDGVMVPDEITVGEAIRDRDRTSIVISTKTASRTAAGARADLETSLRNLGTDYVDIIHLHALMTPDEREMVLSHRNCALIRSWIFDERDSCSYAGIGARWCV